MLGRLARGFEVERLIQSRAGQHIPGPWNHLLVPHEVAEEPRRLSTGDALKVDGETIDMVLPQLLAKWCRHAVDQVLGK